MRVRLLKRQLKSEGTGSRGLALGGGFRQRADQTQDGPELAEAQTVTVEEFSESEIVLQGVGPLGTQVLRQLGDERDIGTFEDGQGIPTGARQVREVVLPAGEKRPPART